jgi:DNA-directed RNA polymerase subunit M/transcription elongation factor TFIIS
VKYLFEHLNNLVSELNEETGEHKKGVPVAILECPQCGEREQIYPWRHDGRPNEVYVKCARCGAVGPQESWDTGLVYWWF